MLKKEGRVVVYLDEEFLARFREWSKTMNRSMSQQIRHIIELFMAREDKRREKSKQEDGDQAGGPGSDRDRLEE